MSSLLSNFYAQACERFGVLADLRDTGDVPPERLLQAIWHHQRLHRDRLRTLEGQPVRVLHPGFLNREGGPDFRDALVGIGDEPPRCGDVEVDLRASGWRAHGHDRNPNFKNVILHVVWEADRTAQTGLAVLALRQTLDAPLGELARWLGSDSAGAFPENLQGQCSPPLRELSAGQLTALLHEAAGVRLRSKASQFQARARSVGWEQALWEGLFRALGYKHNTWPMQALAEHRLRWSEGCVEALEFQARLLGLSGLLPAELNQATSPSGRYLRRVWDQWWREREAFLDCVLPRAVWHLHGLRPANHPQRRLALAAHWLADGKVPNQLEVWCAADLSPAALVDSLLEILQARGDDFWSWHWTLRSSRLAKPQPLLGATRVSDLAVNVILPWLWIRAAEGGNERLRKSLEGRYFAWPAAEDNAVLRLARQRLLGNASPQALPDAAAQQGLLQIVRDFCDSSTALCDECRFPDVVREWRACGGHESEERQAGLSATTSRATNP
ncbi:MAG TPA: DUF2851 family protein [Verrucomicrobiae bacterium]